MIGSYPWSGRRPSSMSSPWSSCRRSLSLDHHLEGQSMGIIRQFTPIFVVVLLAMLQGSPARAGFENGNRLYEYCSKPNEVFCLAYVMGVIDGARANWKKES